jgi:hypothetical protein
MIWERELKVSESHAGASGRSALRALRHGSGMQMNAMKNIMTI